CATGDPAVRADEKPTQQPKAVWKLLGSSRETVRGQLGKPDRTGKDFDSFYAAGVAVEYDGMGRAKDITATPIGLGDDYKCKVLGVALGDSRKDCVAAWGNPVKAEKTPFEYERVTWHHKGYVLELEVWVKDGDGSDKAFGKYKKDTVKQIALSKKAE